MKFIKKNKTEPPKLKEYRETTSNPTWSGYADNGQELKKALLKEQGHICAYCMKRISLKRSDLGRGERSTKPMIEVEHYKSRYSFPELQLDYENMLAVCNGYTQGSIHCDKSKLKRELKVVNPLDNNIESEISYSLDGSIFSLKDIEDINNDLNSEKLLNLNCTSLKKARSAAIDVAKDLLSKKYPLRLWTKKIIQKEIDEWKSKDSNGKYRQFCQIAIWFWEDQKKRNRYPAE